MTLTFNPLRAMIMAYNHAKVQGQWPVGSKESGNGRTDGGDSITFCANAIGNHGQWVSISRYPVTITSQLSQNSKKERKLFDNKISILFT